MPILVKIGVWMLVALANTFMLYHGFKNIACANQGIDCWLEDGKSHMKKMAFWFVITYILLYITY